MPPPVRPSAPPVPAELLALRDYRVERLLGQGGMGAVYLARNLLMDRPEVLKVVNTAFLRKPGALERFQQEIRNAARLQHPNIVGAYTCLRAGDLLVFAMEYVPGKDLAQAVKEGGPVPVANACYYVQQAARGLQHAHEKGMVHRDIKPANLMLARDGKKHVIKVLDFGLAKLAVAGEGAVDGADGPADSGLTGAGRMLGTPDYVAPEQTLDAARADIRADIYSLGCTLYFLLTGRPPFAGRSLAQVLEAHHSREADPLDRVRPDVPPDLAAVVMRMMAKDPARRFQTPQDVALALQPFVRTGARAVTTPASAVPVPAPATAEGPARAAETIAPSRRQTAGGPPPVPAGTAHAEWWAELDDDSESSGLTKSRRSARGRSGLWVALAGAGVLGLAAAGLAVAWAAGAFRGKTAVGPVAAEGSPVDARGRTQPPAKTAPGPEFVSLFNGTDLTGWSADGTPRDAWRVEQGAITTTGTEYQQGGWLLNDRSFSDFLVRFEFQAEPGANSGFGFRAVPGEHPAIFANGQTGPVPEHLQVEIFGDPPGGGANGTGLILGDARASRALRPTRPARLNPAGQWNAMEVESRGQAVRVWVNGDLLLDASLDDLVNQGSAYPGLKRASGRLGFQRNSKTVRFRRIEVRDLSVGRAGSEGYLSLFNGKDLTGWYTDGGQAGRWDVENGALVGRSAGYAFRDYLLTVREYADFTLRFEFLAETGWNGGVVLRAVEGERLPLGKQFIFDHPLIKLTDPALNPAYPPGTTHWVRDGRIDGKPAGGPALPAGAWHRVEVTVRGDTCVALFDGQRVVDVKLDPDPANYLGCVPALKRARGKVGFQIHSGIMRFRNVEIRPE